MSGVVLKSWVKQIRDIQAVFARVGLPVSIEEDKTNTGNIDAQINLEDIDTSKEGNTLQTNFNMDLVLKANRKHWADLIVKMEALSKEFANDQEWFFDGWQKRDDEKNLIYEGKIRFVGLIYHL